MATTTTTAPPGSTSDPQIFMHTSGATPPVWTHLLPFTSLPTFPPLSHDLTTSVCVIGSGIAGIHVAYELVKRGHEVVMLEARDVLSGESGRTSGHLTNDLDDGYVEIKKKHGLEGARVAAESHAWARERVGEVARELGLECEYRKVRAVNVSQFPVGEEGWKREMGELREEAGLQRELGIESRFDVSCGRCSWMKGEGLTMAGKSDCEGMERQAGSTWRVGG